MRTSHPSRPRKFPRLTGLLVALMVGAPSVAYPYEVFGMTLGLTSQGLSVASTEATRADERRQQREEDQRERHRHSAGTYQGGAAAGTQCARDDECTGTCVDGRCVDPPRRVRGVPPPAPNEVEPECTDATNCGPGRSCSAGRCLDEPPPTPTIQQCSSDAQCAPGQTCAVGQCLSPPPPPESTLLERGRERYLQERAVELRQDLALGEGPVLGTLATLQRVTPAALGRATRQHRAELVALIGDRGDDAWPPRLLRRLDELGAQVARSTNLDQARASR